MPIRVLENGTIEVDSPEDAVRVRDLILAQQAKQSRHASSQHASENGRAKSVARKAEQDDAETRQEVSAPTQEGPNIDEFWEAVSAEAKRAIKALAYGNAAGLTTDTLAQAIKVPTTRLTHIVRGIRSQAGRSGLGRDRILRKETYHDQGKPKSRYQLDERVIQWMRDMGH